MASYVYKCRICKNEKNVYHSIHESPTIMCECGEIMHRMLFPPRVIGEPTTIGSLAEKNSKSLPNHVKSSTMNNENTGKTSKNRTKTYKEINKMTQDRKLKYIMEGK